jgi:hypothetical protein
VSRHHASLQWRDGGWRLFDLQSKNGTQLDGTRVDAAGDPLQETSWVSFGGVLARFERLSEELAARAQDEHLRRWQSSVELQRKITPSMGLAPLLERLLDSVLELSRTERAFVLLSQPDGSLVLSASRGMPAGTVLADDFAGSVGAVQLALQKGQPVATSDAQLDARLAQRASIADRKIRALVCMPLVAADRLVGAIYADSSRAGAELTELDVDILSGLATHAALAITVVRLDEELARVAAGLQPALSPPPSAPQADTVVDVAAAELTEGAARATEPIETLPSTGERADDTGLHWDELLLKHRERAGRER